MQLKPVQSTESSAGERNMTQACALCDSANVALQAQAVCVAQAWHSKSKAKQNQRRLVTADSKINARNRESALSQGSLAPSTNQCSSKEQSTKPSTGERNMTQTCALCDSASVALQTQAVCVAQAWHSKSKTGQNQRRLVTTDSAPH